MSLSSNIILESKELCKTYVLGKKNQQNILKNINLQIRRGEFISLMGPSGSGKSTLLYNISGMDRMSSGSIIFNGQNFSSLSNEQLSALRLHKMGFIFQQIHLLKNLSIFDNIILSAYLVKNANRKKINRSAIELMEKMGIAELANNDITQASGGQLQRVAICRALINNPEIIFGDEPTGSLNSSSANKIMEILGDINKLGTTILLATHDVKVAAKTERVLYMLDGKIVAEYYPDRSIKQTDFKEREQKLSEWLINLGF